jgi:hypothetical protein
LGTGSTSLLIDNPLSNRAAKRLRSALCVRHIQRITLVISEIELGQIPLQVLLANVMVRTRDAALTH